MEYLTWAALSTDRAQKALDQGGKLWRLPVPFGNGMAVYRHGLSTAEGGQYVVSERIVSRLKIPGAAPAPARERRSGGAPGL